MRNANTQKATLTLKSGNPTEATKESPVDTADEVVATGISAKDMAAAEEKLAAQRAEMVKAMQLAPEPVQEDIASATSKGREYLHQKLREHAERQAKKAEEERPKPFLTPAMRARIEAEQEAGRRAQAKHQARWDARPRPVPGPEVWDGKTETVARPGNLVPDPAKGLGTSSVSGNFVAGDRIYSPNV